MANASSRTRIAAQGVAAIVGLALGVGVFTLPERAAGEIERRLIDRAARHGVALSVDKVWVEPLSRVTLDGLTLDDAATGARIGSIRRLQVAYELHGVRSPRVFLRSVDVRDPRLRVTRSADGRVNLEAVIRGFLQGRESKAGGGGGGGLRQYLSRHVPKLTVRGMQLQVDDAKGGPLLTPGGVDLRHLRLNRASFVLEDHSPVQEQIELRWSGRTHVAGMPGEISARGVARLPERTGEVHVTLPKRFALQVGGVKAAVQGVSAFSDGRVEITGIEVSREDGGGRLSLDVRKVSARVSRTPAPESVVPDRLRKRLPAAAVLALRHVRRVEVHRPVVVGQRVAETAQPGGSAGDSHGEDDEATPEHADEPASEGGEGTDRPGKRAAKRKAGRKTAPGKKTVGKKAAGKKAHGKKTASKKAAGKKTAGKKAPRDGSKVREALRRLLTGASDKLEAQLARLRLALTALPLDEIRVHHGSARLRGEEAAAAPTREVSDYNLLIQRKDGAIAAALDFAVPGRKGTQRISGRVVEKTGDMHLKVRLDHLPLAPYAAVLPGNLNLHDDSALYDTRVTVQVDAKDRTISVEGKAALRGLDVRAPKISRHLLADLQLGAKGRLTFDLAREQVRLDDATLSLAKVTAMVSGAVLRYRSAPAFDLHAKVPTVTCQDMVDALVPNVAPMLDGMRCKGTASFRLDLGLDTADMRSLKLDYKPLLRKLEITSLGRYIHFDVLTQPFEHHARQKDASLYTFVTGPGSERWASLPAISDHMAQVVTTTEDGAFFWHKGFSLRQIRSAMVANLLRGRFVRGASTISQQVVKNLFFVEREKTVARKLQEAVITWQMEQVLEKNQILELYFNIIEFGPRIYGIRAAANHYFSRDPSELTLIQAIWLGSIIPNPKAFYHQFTRGAVKPSWQRYLCWIAGVMVKREKITPAVKAQLGDCAVTFGTPPEPEAPGAPGEGLGHEGPLEGLPGGRQPGQVRPEGDAAPLPPPKLPTARTRPAKPRQGGLDNPFAPPPRPRRRPAPSVPDDEQP